MSELQWGGPRTNPTVYAVCLQRPETRGATNIYEMKLETLAIGASPSEGEAGNYLVDGGQPRSRWHIEANHYIHV